MDHDISVMFNKKIIISRHFLKLFNSDVSIIEQVVLVNIRKFVILNRGTVKY